MTAELLDAVSVGDLARLADRIEIPSDLPWSPRARAFIDVTAVGPEHRPQDPCQHRTVYQPVFSLEGGRRDVPAGPAFADHASAAALVRLLNHAGDRDATPSPEPATPRSCLVCGTPLPPESRAHRTTCGETCRQRLARERRSVAQGGGGPPAARAPGPAAGPGDAARVPARASLTAPHENVTARAVAPAAQLELELFSTPNTETDPAAAIEMPAGSGTEQHPHVARQQ